MELQTNSSTIIRLKVLIRTTLNYTRIGYSNLDYN